jgi:glyoxylase I family protein
LQDLSDDDFIEIGSSATIYNKTEIMNWFQSGEQFARNGSSFKTHQLSENIILLTYISAIKDTPISETKYAMRASIWRLRENKWRMIFHQGTHMK